MNRYETHNLKLLLNCVHFEMAKSRKLEVVLLESYSLKQYVKVFFVTLKPEGIMYHREKDFNNPSRFHDVLKSTWADAKVADLKFGTDQHRTRIDELADKKVREAYLDPEVGFNSYRNTQK